MGGPPLYMARRSKLKGWSRSIAGIRSCAACDTIACMRLRLASAGARSIFAALIFAILAAAILSRSPKWLSDFDQPFYLTIAYDLDRHGVFSNGLFDDVEQPPGGAAAGMFFGPLYPWLIFGATKLDPRFAKAVECSVEASHKVRDGAECEVYARPMHLMHAALLALGVLAIALAAEIIASSAMAFWLAGMLATVALLPDAELFSYVMTESVTFCLYSAMTWALVMAWSASGRRYFALAGIALGLLCLARPSFQVLALVLPVLIVLGARFRRSWTIRVDRPAGIRPCLCSRRRSLGRPQLPRGRQARLERGIRHAVAGRALCLQRMTVREFLLAFPYCVPEIGPVSRPTTPRGRMR